MLLSTWVLAAAIASPPPPMQSPLPPVQTPLPPVQSPPPPLASFTLVLPAASQRSREHPLSQTELQPIQTTPCANARPGCRHIDFFDFRAGGAIHRVQINEDLDYLGGSGTLALFLGESVVVILDSAKPGPANIVFGSGGLVANSSDSVSMQPLQANQVRLSLSQVRGREDVQLIVENRGKLLFSYDTRMVLYNTATNLPDPTIRPAGACEVKSEGQGIRSWYMPLVELFVGAVQLVPAHLGRLKCQ